MPTRHAIARATQSTLRARCVACAPQVKLQHFTATKKKMRVSLNSHLHRLSPLCHACRWRESIGYIPKDIPLTQDAHQRGRCRLGEPVSGTRGWQTMKPSTAGAGPAVQFFPGALSISSLSSPNPWILRGFSPGAANQRPPILPPKANDPRTLRNLAHGRPEGPLLPPRQLPYRPSWRRQTRGRDPWPFRPCAARA